MPAKVLLHERCAFLCALERFRVYLWRTAPEERTRTDQQVHHGVPRNAKCGGPQGASVPYCADNGTVPTSFVLFGTNCYQYVGAMGCGHAPWLAARTMCSNNGAFSRASTTRAENQFLTSLAYYYNTPTAHHA